MEINNLRITKLREYLFNVIKDINSEYQQINIYFLSDDINNYSIDKIPVDKEVERWITGDVLYRDVYSFRSRMDYSADVISNIESVGFYELFEKIINNNNKSGILPDIAGIESIECLNCGTMVKANTNTAEFDIQIQIKYKEVEEQQENFRDNLRKSRRELNKLLSKVLPDNSKPDFLKDNNNFVKIDDNQLNKLCKIITDNIKLEYAKKDRSQ